MKKIFLIAITTAAIACGGRGEDRQEQMGTPNESIDNTPATETSLGDTTATSNNNMYNADSPAGKGGVYDTSAQRSGEKGKR